MRALIGRGRRLVRDRGGASAVEFALVVPLLLGVTLGIIDAGRMMWTVTALQHSARETARYAAVHNSKSLDPKSDTELLDFAVDSYIGFGKEDTEGTGLTIVIAWDPANDKDATVTVTISTSFSFWTTALLMPDGTLTLEGRAVMTS